jgi:2-keto-3-deoxy-L-arabinonate dehydratase
MPLPKKVLQKGITDMVRISDGRMSGTAYGAVVLHVSPEAAAGGPLALVQTGDMIELDVEARRLHLEVSDEELAKRRAAWQAPELPRRGYYQPPSIRGEPEAFYYEFFASVLERTGANAGIQNAPEYLGVGLSAESIAALAAEQPNFRLLKGEGPAGTIRATIERLRALEQPLAVFNGRGGQELVDNLRAGCDGLIVAPDAFDRQVAIHQAFVEGHEHDAESLYAQTLPEIVFVMQSLETLTCYGKRIAAWRMGFDVVHDRGARPTPFGIECARRFAQRLGPASRVLRG